MAAVTICSDFGFKKIKSVTVSIVSPSICHVMYNTENLLFIAACHPASCFTLVFLLPLFTLSLKHLFTL